MNGLARGLLAAWIGFGLTGCGGPPPAKTEPKSGGAGQSATATRRKSMEAGPHRAYPDDEETIVPAAPSQAQKAKASRTTGETKVEEKTPAKPDATKDGKAARAATAVELMPVDLAGFEQKVAGLKGKTVVVDCWAMWCGPCIQKFPKFVELSQKRASDKIVFIGLNFDDEVDGIKSAREFLIEHEVGFPNLRMTTKPAVVFKKFGVEALPAYLVFAADGSLSLKATGTSAMDQLESKLAGLN